MLSLQSLSPRRPTGKDLPKTRWGLRNRSIMAFPQYFRSSWLVHSRWRPAKLVGWLPGRPGAPTEANKVISPSVSFRLDAKPQHRKAGQLLSSTWWLCKTWSINVQRENRTNMNCCPTSFHHLFQTMSNIFSTYFWPIKGTQRFKSVSSRSLASKPARDDASCTTFLCKKNIESRQLR